MLWPITAQCDDALAFQLDSLVRKCKVLFFLAWWTGVGPTLQSVPIDFLKVIITAVVCIAAVDCYTSQTRGVRRDAGTASGGTFG